MSTFTRTDSGDATLVALSGTLDAATAPDLRSLTERLVADGRHDITLDMAELNLIDSSGVGAIVALFKAIRAQGGAARLVNVQDQPRMIFHILRLDRVFNL